MAEERSPDDRGAVRGTTVYRAWEPGARLVEVGWDSGCQLNQGSAETIARLPHAEAHRLARTLADATAPMNTGRGVDPETAEQDQICDRMGQSQPGTRPVDFDQQLQQMTAQWALELQTGSEPPAGRPRLEQRVVLKDHDPLGEAKVLAALLCQQSGKSHDRTLASLLKYEGCSRREMFLELAKLRKRHSEEFDNALELQKYTFAVLLSRRQMAYVRRTSNAVVIEQALEPRDMPECPGNHPASAGGSSGEYDPSETEHWVEAQAKLTAAYLQLEAMVGPREAEYVLPCGTDARATIITTALDLIRLIERLHGSQDNEYEELANALWDTVDEDAADGGILALILWSPRTGATAPASRRTSRN